MPRLQACLRRRGHKKDHNAASVEGRYRGQYQPTPRSARRTPRNPSQNAASAGTAPPQYLEPTRGQKRGLRPQGQLGFREDLRAIIPLARRGVGAAADVVNGEWPGLVLQ